MFVLVSAESGRSLAEVKDAKNLNQLHVEFRQVEDSLAGEALAAAGLGTVEDGYVWLDIGALRAAGKGGGDWNDRFEAMLRYARRNDWVDAEGTRVRAHIVRN